MTELWVAVIFAVVIVVGMSVTRVWEAVVSAGAPLLESLLARSKAAEHAAAETDRITTLDRRIERLDERIEFLEDLLERREPASLESPRQTTSRGLGAPEP